MKGKLILIVCIAIPVSFVIGYQLGHSNALNEYLSSETITLDTLKESRQITEQDNSLIINKRSEGKEISLSKNNPLKDVSVNKEEPQIHNSKIEQLGRLPPESASIIEKLTFLLTISTSNKPDDMDLFSPALNLLKKAVKDDPQNLQILLDYFLEADSDSRAPYYITSILQGANIPDKEFILNNLVQSLSSMGSKSANTKMLHLIASTGAHHDNPQITQNLKNIAIYEDEISENRLYALDLLMPFQLKEEEKFKIVNDFKSALDSAGSEEKSYWIENIIRFSDKQEREQLAANYLQNNNDFETRVAILSTLHTGSVRPNNKLKEQLFKIAQDPNDPLTRHAKDALLYVFEINNDEYQVLQNTGG